VRCGVSVELERSGRLALRVPVALAGWLVFGVVCQPDFFAVVWLERGEPTSTRNRKCLPRFGHQTGRQFLGQSWTSIDPHKATHTAVAINEDEVVLDELTTRATTGQARPLCDWASDFENREWAIESANGLGYLVSRQLVAASETVFDVPPVFASRVRVLRSGRSQTNDANDARSVAIAALRSDRIAQVGQDGHARVIRLLAKRHRYNAQTSSLKPNRAARRSAGHSFAPPNKTDPERATCATNPARSSTTRFRCLWGLGSTNGRSD